MSDDLTITSPEKEALRALIRATGAAAVGFARCAPVSGSDDAVFNRWCERHDYAGMDYMTRHSDLRRDPALLLDGAATVISIAYNYNPATKRDPSLPKIARFAYGRDYHKAIPALLRPVCRHITETYGALTRICTDSAPIRERYWATMAGIAVRGRNGLAIVPGVGSWVVLAEILTTLTIEPDKPTDSPCLSCGKCLAACPGGAIRPDATIDASKCLSYNTIEQTTEYTPSQADSIGESRTLFGCDICQNVCPHNRDAAPGEVSALQPREETLSLTINDLLKMTEDEFNHRFAGTSLRRAGLPHLQATAQTILALR